MDYNDLSSAPNLELVAARLGLRENIFIGRIIERPGGSRWKRSAVIDGEVSGAIDRLVGKLYGSEEPLHIYIYDGNNY